MKLTGVFETEHAEKYVAQLCKHFAHKLPVKLEDRTGYAELPTGPATITAHPACLAVDLTVVDPIESDRAKQIIDKHLLRFAFRENFTTMRWQLRDT